MLLSIFALLVYVNVGWSRRVVFVVCWVGSVVLEIRSVVPARRTACQVGCAVLLVGRILGESLA